MKRSNRSPVLGDLSQADYNIIQAELVRQDQVRQAIQKALSAGIPCGDQDEACQSNMKQLQLLKSVYFPELP